MAVENLLLAKTFTVSGNDLSAAADQYIFVKAGATSPQVVAAAASDPTLGISQATAKTTAGISIGLEGISKLRLGGTVHHGSLLRADASGLGVMHLGLGPYGAQALEDGSSGEVIEVKILTGLASSS
ncbi:MAG: hypothetical protein KKG25_16375 [Bacteroidetes bacterium]|nr:hypothetical protein [Bacteroidota bacterium]MBU1486425.1 hypothetical protein [Bacteroidota bacterium]MBU2249918.1 hypothetical protein [Gammaproteobacteria bacterium]